MDYQDRKAKWNHDHFYTNLALAKKARNKLITLSSLHRLNRLLAGVAVSIVPASLVITAHTQPLTVLVGTAFSVSLGTLMYGASKYLNRRINDCLDTVSSLDENVLTTMSTHMAAIAARGDEKQSASIAASRMNRFSRYLVSKERSKRRKAASYLLRDGKDTFAADCLEMNEDANVQPLFRLA